VPVIFHLLDPAEWSRTQISEDGELRPPSLDAEGFVHFSFADQVAGSANRHLPDAPALVALEVDAELCGDRLVVEDSYGSGTAFPHLYGPLPVIAVVAVHPLSRGADGAWVFEPA
jgi:uncharacterized protein (DUF952 family)